MEVTEHRIDAVEAGSIAESLGIEAGDFLLAINGKPLTDVFDYHFLINDDHLTVTVKKKNGQDWEYEIEKNYYEDLGIVFYNGLMDDYRSCNNNCIFCFIDQMPPNMRETLYFKDDDSRLSFLQGNYVTLTNMSDADAERIIRYKMSPINISVHTTNPQLRVKMLHNRMAGESLKRLKQFADAGVEMNGQIVLCRGINDGKELERTIRDLSGYLPAMRSLSIVPVGLTRFRKGLYPLKPFTKADAQRLLDTVEKWQKKCFAAHGLHFVHASDEFYLLAEREFPPEDTYDGFLQLENGVGMIPLLESEFMECLEEQPAYKEPRPKFRLIRRWKEQPEDTRRVRSIATGKLAAPLIRKLALAFMIKNPDIKIQVFEIENHFFGERITVSGLLTGTDLKDQLRGKKLGEALLLPSNMLRSGEDVFLDDMTLQELADALRTDIIIVSPEGKSLFDAMRAGR